MTLLFSVASSVVQDERREVFAGLAKAGRSSVFGVRLGCRPTCCSQSHLKSKFFSLSVHLLLMLPYN